MTAWKALVDWLFRNRESGRIVVGQTPNAAISVWGAATLARVLDLLPQHEQRLAGVAAGALIVWGLDELVRGVNPFRRILGVAILGWQLARFVG